MYVSNILGKDVLFTYNTENIKHVLSVRFADYSISQLRTHMFQVSSPHSILALEGPEWRRMRAIFRKQLSAFRNIQSRNNFDVQESLFQGFTRRVPPDGQSFDIQELFLDFSLDLMTSFAFGDSIGALGSFQSPEKKLFKEDIRFVKEVVAQLGFSGPLHHLFQTRRFLEACARVQAYTRAYAKLALEASKSSDIAEEYIFIQRLANDIKDTNKLRDQCMSVFLGAIDAIAGLLSATVFLLARNNRVMAKLRASILDNIGYNPPTYEKLESLRYMRCVFNEALRLFPAVPLNGRVANKDTILPYGGGDDGNSPVLVQRGTIVIFSTWASHRMAESFNSSPDDFYPERWEQLGDDTPGFLPFNKGPRNCPGQKYAIIAASFVMVRILQTFSELRSYDTREWRATIGLALLNENGIRVGLS